MSDWKSKQIERFRSSNSEDIMYDYFKHLVSLSLITIGGMVTIGQGLFGDALPLRELSWAVGLVGIGGVLAFQGQFEIVRIAGGGEASVWLRFVHRLAPISFGAGIGVFLGSIFIPAL
ncbi:hypothetical protein [Erythrobacter sp. HKB08]|uniref:hypothetical protein n=1 Tax=Erythrobacter sp. HKB08 TaxID=2502843 RepID=UPI0010091DE5|nr:hypothetical protein [Erythrobacter sp. HKB08]